MVGEMQAAEACGSASASETRVNPWTIWSGRGECNYCFATVISTTDRGLKASDPAGRPVTPPSVVGKGIAERWRFGAPCCRCYELKKLRKLSGGLP
jgi:hypothetical protein